MVKIPFIADVPEITAIARVDKTLEKALEARLAQCGWKTKSGVARRLWRSGGSGMTCRRKKARRKECIQHRALLEFNRYSSSWQDPFPLKS